MFLACYVRLPPVLNEMPFKWSSASALILALHVLFTGNKTLPAGILSTHLFKCLANTLHINKIKALVSSTSHGVVGIANSFSLALGLWHTGPEVVCLALQSLHFCLRKRGGEKKLSKLHKLL